MAIKRSMVLWRRATPLDEAWLVYASAAARAAHEQLPGWQNALSAPDAIDPDAKLVDRLLSGFGAMSRAHTEKASSELRLKAELFQRILNGEFELLGFRTFPDRSRNPVIVPSERIGKIEPNWKEGSLDLRYESYSDLRVSPIADRATGMRRGRPGSNEIILEMIRSLHAEPNSNFCKVERKEACERVRDKLRSEGYSVGQRGDGTTNQNIAKLILTICPARKIKLEN